MTIYTKPFYNISLNDESKEATIYIYGVIGGFDYENWRPINTANNFIEEFKAVEAKADIIHTRINSPGGNIWDGLPIYNTLKNSKKTVYTYVDGIAYSMASLIAMAGDKVYGYKNSMLMFHNGGTYAFGNAQDLRNEADTLDRYDDSLASILEEKLNISVEAVKEKYLNFKDNYFVGDKAKEIGFFDEIITATDTDNTNNVPENVTNMSSKDLFLHYQNIVIPTENKTPKNTPIKMSKTKILVPAIQNVLGYEEGFGSNENGVFLQETELNKVEDALTNAATNVSNLETQVSDAAAITNDASTSINSALDNAEIKYTDKNTLTEKINLLNEQRNEYAAKTAGATTKLPVEANVDAVISPTNMVGNLDITEALNN